jgi:hypothetical protein
MLATAALRSSTSAAEVAKRARDACEAYVSLKTVLKDKKLLTEKAYVYGQWKTARSGKTFDVYGMTAWQGIRGDGVLTVSALVFLPK